MSHKLRRNSALLAALCELTSQQRKALLKHATNDQISCLSEIAYNLLASNIPVSDKTRKKLAKHKHTLRALANPRTSIKKRKQLLIQKGGFLPFLIPAAASLIGALLRPAS